MILLDSSVWVLNQKNFEGLFKESEAVLARTAEWVDHLNQVLPISTKSKEWLAERLRQNSVLRRKVQSILRSTYLPRLTPDTLRAKMAGHGLAAEVLVKDGSLVFNKDTERDLLLFLNEDLDQEYGFCFHLGVTRPRRTSPHPRQCVPFANLS